MKNPDALFYHLEERYQVNHTIFSTLLSIDQLIIREPCWHLCKRRPLRYLHLYRLCFPHLNVSNKLQKRRGGVQQVLVRRYFLTWCQDVKTVDLHLHNAMKYSSLGNEERFHFVPRVICHCYLRDRNQSGESSGGLLAAGYICCFNTSEPNRDITWPCILLCVSSRH